MIPEAKNLVGHIVIAKRFYLLNILSELNFVVTETSQLGRQL